MTSEAADILGEEWVARTLPLAADGLGSAGAPVATLVHQRDAGNRERAVLYLHGFTDYFFQAAHAQKWAAHGYDFYALDLRDNGRSIRPGRQPGWITDLARYNEEISLALALLREAGHQHVVLLGHSTGGLIASLYAHDHPGSVDALVLNSPWFDLNSTWFNRVAATRLLDLIGPAAPHLKVGTLGEAYGRALHRSTGGDWDYDLTLKPFEGFPVQAGWFRAIRRGHRRLAAGLEIEVPVLVCTSGRSGHHVRPTPEELASADCVLNVAHMRARAGGLGPAVDVVSVPGGRHDLALSQEPARGRYEYLVFDWLNRHLPR